MSMQKPVAVMGTGRLEAFSDGVFAVAITLLVLNIQLPQGIPQNILQDPTSLEQTIEGNLRNAIPEILSYIVSFVIIGVYWVGHHNTCHYIKRSDRTLLWINILFLMCIVFIPYPTGLIGRYPFTPAVIVIYGGTLVVTGSVLQLIWWYATHHHRLVERDIDPALVKKATRRNMLPPLSYLGAIIISFISPPVSLLIFAFVPLLYIIPGRIDEYWTRRREEAKVTMEN